MLLSFRGGEKIVKPFHFELRGEIRGRVTWEPYAWVHCTRCLRGHSLRRSMLPCSHRRSSPLSSICHREDNEPGPSLDCLVNSAKIRLASWPQVIIPYSSFDINVRQKMLLIGGRIGIYNWNFYYRQKQ